MLRSVAMAFAARRLIVVEDGCCSRSYAYETDRLDMVSFPTWIWVVRPATMPPTHGELMPCQRIW